MLSTRPTHFDDAPPPSLFDFRTKVLDTTLPSYRKTDQEFYTRVGSLITPAFRPDQGHANSPDIRRVIERIHKKYSRRVSQELSAGSSSPLARCQRTMRKTSRDPPSKQGSHGWRNGSWTGITTTDSGFTPKSMTPSHTPACLPAPASSPPWKHNSPDASVSPMINSFTISSSNSPENWWTSPNPSFGTPASSISYNTSRSVSLGADIDEEPKAAPIISTPQAFKSVSRPSRKNRRPTHEIVSVADDGSSITIPLDVDSASGPEGERRKQERAASQRYRQNKKARLEQTKRTQPPGNGIVAGTDDGQVGRTNSTLAPPISAEISLSTSQRSHSSTHSGSTDVSCLSGLARRASQGNLTSGHGWPDLPELHPYERREKIDYEVLSPYGSPEAIQTYPESFQASLHRTMDFKRIENLRTMSHRVLFVYGSLMISDLSHDISEEPADWVFHAQITKRCMCPAKVRGYSRFSTHDDDDEPIMMKSEKNSQDSTHGMLIFGLTEDNFRVLDRYVSRGFAREEVTAHVNLKGSSTSFPVLTYVWPQIDAPPEAPQQHVRINQDTRWTVEHFWKHGKLCRIWRETMEEWRAELEKVAEQRATAAAQYFEMLRVHPFPHEDFVAMSDVDAFMS